MKCLPSTLKIQLLQITLRANPRLIFIHLIKVLKKEEELIESEEEHHEKMIIFSSILIQKEVLTLTSEHPSFENHFERKSQDNISPSDQIFEKQEEELI